MCLRRITQHRQGRTYTYYARADTTRTPHGAGRPRTRCYLGRLDNLRPPDTYCEGRRAGNPQAQRGYARDHRPDGKHLCLGLVVNRDGGPLGFESRAGNTRAAATLTLLITALEQRCGGARRVGCFDRGMAAEDNRRHGRQTQRVYWCAVRRAVTRQYLEASRRGPWQCLRADGHDAPTLAVQRLPDQEPDGVRER
jgi:hypothetical protein